MPAACWSRPRGQRREPRDHCGHASCGSAAGAASMWRRWLLTRKLAVLIWHLLHKGESYLWARPALHAKKMRELELKVGHKGARRQRGTAHAYNLKSHRAQERRWVEQAEGLTHSLWQAGAAVVRDLERCARALERRSDDKGCVARFVPQALLFATEAPVRERRVHQLTRPTDWIERCGAYN
jgi:hypothetical protein